MTLSFTPAEFGESGYEGSPNSGELHGIAE